MQADFWHRRWTKNEIGFHLETVNPHLQREWAQLPVPAGATVLVPLCGKSLDMAWLAGQGLRVIGVELSALAVAAFFREQGLEPVLRQQGAFAVWEAQGVTILCGDFFALQPADLADVSIVYDRASLIALPPAMRAAYVAHLRRLLPQASILLITLDYEQEQMDGPPFAVSAAEVEGFYAAGYDLAVLGVYDVLADSPRFRDKGLTRLEERVYRLLPLGAG